MSQKSSTPTLEPGQKSSALPVTVTGVDRDGQLFRDAASIVFLKGQKCAYLSKFKPSSGSSVMMEIRGAKEDWRSQAKVQSVAPLGSDRNTFRVTVELERAHSAVIGSADEEPPTEAPSIAEKRKSRSDTAEPAATANAASKEPTAPVPIPRAIPPAPARAEFTPAAPPIPAPSFAPTPAAKTMVADVVRSAVTAELEQLKSELRTMVVSQVEAALRDPIHKIEAQITQLQAQQAQQRPALSEESVRKVAAQAAENAQIESASTSQKIVAEAVRSAMASHSERQRRETGLLVGGEIEAAMQPLAAHIDGKVEETIETRLDEYFRKRPPVTEETVRKLAAQVAENVQLEWASTKLQKMVNEAVRSTLASDSDQRRAEITAIVSKEIETAVSGPLTARIEAALENTLAAKMERHVQTPSAIGVLQKLVAEAVRSTLALESDQRRAEITEIVSREIETVSGPLTARIEATLENTLAAKIEWHLQAPAAIDVLQELVREAVRQPLDAEYEERGRQVQAVVSGEIEAAVHGPIAAQMEEMLQKALEAQREEYFRTPPAITEEALRQITAGIAEHPQFQKSIDALTADLAERWTAVARGATATAQQDVSSRIAATERLAGQVVADIQQKLNSFSVDINRILASQEADAALSSPDSPVGADKKERDNRFREVLQSTGSHFEHEMKAALQKIFGKK